MADSVNAAACYCWARMHSNPSLSQVSFEDDTVYEVQPAGESTVYRVGHRKMLTWAAQLAERRLKKTKTA